jgi:hypothetical protein
LKQTAVFRIVATQKSVHENEFTQEIAGVQPKIDQFVDLGTCKQTFGHVLCVCVKSFQSECFPQVC